MKSIFNKKTTKQGFTLLELLVVVAIIAILALIVLLVLNPAELARRSRDSRRMSDLGTLRKAIDLTLADGTALPGTTGVHYTKNTGAGGSVLDATNVSNLVGMDISKYLSGIPQDPMYKAVADTIQTSTGASCPTGITTTARSAMVYEFSSDGQTYELRSYLESKDNCETLTKDNGNNTDRYELGNDPGLDLL